MRGPPRNAEEVQWWAERTKRLRRKGHVVEPWPATEMHDPPADLGKGLIEEDDPLPVDEEIRRALRHAGGGR